MSRSLWKGPVTHFKLTKKVNLNKKRIKINTHSRSSMILPSFINKKINIHNGRKFITILIIDEMIGHKLGEFVPTRNRYIFKKIKNKK